MEVAKQVRYTIEAVVCRLKQPKSGLWQHCSMKNKNWRDKQYVLVTRRNVYRNRPLVLPNYDLPFVCPTIYCDDIFWFLLSFVAKKSLQIAKEMAKQVASQGTSFFRPGWDSETNSGSTNEQMRRRL